MKKEEFQKFIDPFTDPQFVTSMSELAGLKASDESVWTWRDYMNAMEQQRKQTQNHRIATTLVVIPEICEFLSENDFYSKTLESIQTKWQQMHDYVTQSQNPQHRLRLLFEERFEGGDFNIFKKVEFLSYCAMTLEHRRKQDSFDMESWVQNFLVPTSEMFDKGELDLS